MKTIKYLIVTLCLCCLSISTYAQAAKSAERVAAKYSAKAAGRTASKAAAKAFAHAAREKAMLTLPKVSTRVARQEIKGLGSAVAKHSAWKIFGHAARNESIRGSEHLATNVAIRSVEHTTTNNALKTSTRTISTTNRTAKNTAKNEIKKDVAKKTGIEIGENSVKQVKTFDPFVGKNYANNGEMILGESHYGKVSDERATFTRDVMKRYQNWLNGSPDGKFEHWMNTYSKTLNAIEGRKLSKEQRANALDKICFYNYVQKVVPEGAGVAPNPAHWNMSRDAFFDVLKEKKPKVAIALGHRLYKNLPKDVGKKGADIIMPDGRIIPTWIYKIDGSETRVMAIQHPGSRKKFDSQYWNYAIEQLRETTR